MKSGMQMMFESMIGTEGAKAIEECKRLLPSVPKQIENMQLEWRTQREQSDRIELLLNRIATQNNLILGRLEAAEYKADPNKVQELPPTLAAHLMVPENVNMFMSEVADD